MIENGISELKSKYDSNSVRAERIAGLIIVGLLVEIAAVFVFQKPWVESVVSISANALIVIGVWGELFFERRSKEAGDKLVTAALERAAKAENDLIEFRTPRRAKIRPQIDALAEQLKPFAGTKFDIGFGGSDGEQADCCWDIEEVLEKANWHQEPWGKVTAGPAAINDRGLLRPYAGNVAATNVEIHIEPEWRQSLLPPAKALISALNGTGVKASAVPFNARSVNPLIVKYINPQKRWDTIASA
jgi:hypothetical protein